MRSSPAPSSLRRRFGRGDKAALRTRRRARPANERARTILRKMSPAIVALVDELRAHIGDRLSISESVREHHSQGESWHSPAAPDAVAFPESTAEVSTIVAACARCGVPVIAFGMGSSLEGHVNAIHGGVSI